MLRNSTASVTEDAFTMPHGDTSKIGHAAPHDSLLDRLTRSSRTRELLPSFPRLTANLARAVDARAVALWRPIDESHRTQSRQLAP